MQWNARQCKLQVGRLCFRRGEEGSNVKDTACQTEGRVKVDEHA